MTRDHLKRIVIDNLSRQQIATISSFLLHGQREPSRPTTECRGSTGHTHLHNRSDRPPAAASVTEGRRGPSVSDDAATCWGAVSRSARRRLVESSIGGSAPRRWAEPNSVVMQQPVTVWLYFVGWPQVAGTIDGSERLTSNYSDVLAPGIDCNACRTDPRPRRRRSLLRLGNDGRLDETIMTLITEGAAHRLADDLGLFGEPAFEHRSFMLDISRDRVPTQETLKWLIDLLATLRYTELQLYVEHTFSFRGHRTVWGSASPITHSEVAELVSYGRERGLELVANLNTFGHMERWLAHPSYRERAECPEGPPQHLRSIVPGPACLAPTDENARFAVELSRELVTATRGQRLMIGGDEPFELGFGRASAEVGRVGRDAVYRTHLGRILRPLIDDGFEVLFWGDQFRTDAASIEWIPEGATVVIWHYEAPQDEGQGVDGLPDDIKEFLGYPGDGHLGFAAHARLALDSNKTVWLACGTSSWNSFVGRNDNAARNIDDAATVGADRGARGLMLTDWGDNGHWQPLVVSLPSIVRAAVAGWNGRAVSPDVDIGGAIDVLLSAPAGTGALHTSVWSPSSASTSRRSASGVSRPTT
ncbi:MAG: family 20 glycosylhydrolase, partial [Actinomycetota bacterium]